MKYPIKNLVLCSILFASSLLAAPPPKYLDVDVNWQQTQTLPALSIQQGASMQLRIRPKTNGRWLTLTGLTARYEARATATNTSAYTASSNLTSNEAHFIQMELDNTQTGTAFTDWVYSVILIDGADEYPIGIGAVNVVASDFAGSSGVLTGSGYQTNGTAASPVDTVNFSAGLTATLTDGTLELTAASAGDLTEITASGLATVTSGTGPIPDIEVTAAAVNAIETDPVWVAVSNTVTAGAALGATALQSYTETDPVWVAVSNTVTACAALGSTALQSEVQDIAAVVALDGDIGTGNITSAAGGTTLDMSSGKFYSSGGTVDISGGTGPALSGLAFSASTDATTGKEIVGWSVLTNQIALLAPAGGDAYLASTQTFTGFNTFDDGSYQVDLLPGSKAAYFDDVSLTHWVEIVNGTYGIKAEVGGASSLIAGQYTDGTRVVNLGDNANGYAVNVTAGASYFDGMVDLNTDALAGSDAVSWSVLTNQIALLAPAGTTNLAGLQDVADLSGAASGEVLEYNGTKWTNATASAGGNPVSTNDVCIVQFNANDTYTLNGHRTLEFDTIVHDSGNNFDTGTYAYTVPTSRMYFVTYYTRGTGSGSRRAFYIRLNGTAKVITDYDALYVDTYSMYYCTALFYAEAGDTIDASVYPYTADFAALGASIRSKLMIIPIGE